MPKRIVSRVSDTFDDSSDEKLEKFIDWTRSTMADYQQSLRRTVAILILLIAVFELIIQSPTTVVSIASFQLSKTSAAFVFLPALVAYLYLQAVMESNRVSRTEFAMRSAFDRWEKRNVANEAHILMEPAQPIYWSLPTTSRIQETPDIVADNNTSSAIAAVLLLGGLAFEIQAFLLLYRQPATSKILFSISACVAGFCIFGAAINTIRDTNQSKLEKITSKLPTSSA